MGTVPESPRPVPASPGRRDLGTRAFGDCPRIPPSLGLGHSGPGFGDAGTVPASPNPGPPGTVQAGPGFGDCAQIPASPRPRVLAGTRGQRGFGDSSQMLAPPELFRPGPAFGDSAGVPKCWPLLHSSGPGQDLGTVHKSPNAAVLVVVVVGARRTSPACIFLAHPLYVLCISPL